jgi:hypothetical protein
MRYRLERWWSSYVHGIVQRYALLTTPSQPGFFLAWLGYVMFVAATLRWFIDLFLLGFLAWRRCETPSIARLEREVVWIPAFMLAGVVIMASTLLSKQTGYARAIPAWVGEALATLAPIALLLVLVGLSIFWVDLRYACK